jgi:predicted GIY-YIG superfamily endonuclease
VYRVYVIQNLEGKFYIGMTENVVITVSQHNEGTSKWTKNRGPWRLRCTREAMSGQIVERESRNLPIIVSILSVNRGR